MTSLPDGKLPNKLLKELLAKIAMDDVHLKVGPLPGEDAAAIDRGEEMAKPGWVRLNFSALMSDDKAAMIVEAVDILARKASEYLPQYRADETTARFAPVLETPESLAS